MLSLGISEQRPVEDDYQGIAIIDAGGGTIDISVYSVRVSSPTVSVTVKEIVPAECKFLYYLIGTHKSNAISLGCLQGSIFVTLRAQQFLQSASFIIHSYIFHQSQPSGKLVDSAYGAPEVVKQIADAFDKTTKLGFHHAGDPQYIRFGTIRDKDPVHNIRAGQLKIPG